QELRNPHKPRASHTPPRMPQSANTIPRSGQNPKILGRDDTEVIRYLITIDEPSPGYFLAQEREDRRFEIGECRMTSIVGDMLVHQGPIAARSDPDADNTRG